MKPGKDPQTTEQPQETMDKFAETVSNYVGLPWNGVMEDYITSRQEKPPGITEIHSC